MHGGAKHNEDSGEVSTTGHETHINIHIDFFVPEKYVMILANGSRREYTLTFLQRIFILFENHSSW